MRVELVTHCFRYSRLLRYHLSSLALWPPLELDLRVTVFFAVEDEATSAVLAWFGAKSVARVEWNWQPLPVLELCRRSIGRNRAALATEADWVWFCDVDYWFGDACWTALAKMNPPRKPLIFPREVQMHAWRSLGDACIAATNPEPGLVAAPRDEFRPQRMRRAIGGIQIARGDVCRERGYLKDRPCWQHSSAHPQFQRCREDRIFRHDLKTSGQGINLPEVFRIRHSRAGRSTPGLAL